MLNNKPLLIVTLPMRIGPSTKSSEVLSKIRKFQNVLGNRPICSDYKILSVLDFNLDAKSKFNVLDLKLDEIHPFSDVEAQIVQDTINNVILYVND